MSALEQRIIALLSSPNYQKLAAYTPPFDPFSVINCSEKNYSNVLHWLLSDSANSTFRKHFVSWISAELNWSSIPLENDVSDAEPIVKCEYPDGELGRVDVLMHFPLKLVVAIEVKVWASEGHKQILRYQNLLARSFCDGEKKVVVFLTRFGVPATTADLGNEEVPVLSMSWKHIADIINKCSGRGAKHNFRIQFSNHICRNIIMESEERRIVVDLLKEGDNEWTARKIRKNFPDFGEPKYEDKFRTIVSKLTDENDLKLGKHKNSQTGEAKELHIEVKKWTVAELPFNLMLYRRCLDDPDGIYTKSAVRVLVSNESYEKNKHSLKKFSKSSEDVVGEFPMLDGWPYWRSVRASEGNQKMVEDTVIDAAFFEDEFWTQVEKRLKSQLDPLLPLIEKWIKAWHKQAETN